MPKLKTVIKIAVVVLLIKELWLLLQIPSVADAVFSFVMIGQVPGTETTLSPNQMMWFLVGVFILASSLIFRTELVELIRGVFKRDVQDIAQPEPVVMPIASPVKAAVTKKKKELPAQPSRYVVFVSQLVARARGSVQQLQLRLHPMIASAKEQVRTGMAATSVAVRKAVIYAWKIALIIYIIISALVIAGWQWLRPRLEKFDRWLDYKLHQNEYTAAVLSVGADIQRSVAKWWTEFKTVDDNEPSK